MVQLGASLTLTTKNEYAPQNYDQSMTKLSRNELHALVNASIPNTTFALPILQSRSPKIQTADVIGALNINQRQQRRDITSLHRSCRGRRKSWFTDLDRRWQTSVSKPCSEWHHTYITSKPLKLYNTKSTHTKVNILIYMSIYNQSKYTHYSLKHP